VSARAHRLEADYHVLPGRKVQIEGWYDLTGDSAVGARVQVFRSDALLAEGKLNDQGVFVFAFEKTEALRVVVDAGAGHRKELTVPADKLEQAGAADARPSGSEGPPNGGSLPGPGEGVPLADRSARVSVKDVLTGVGFLLALAAFVLSLRNARQLRRWKRECEEATPRRRGADD
jgi:hypothetical protein